jgi:acetyltransferase-like isoleucine patch superfamily enzyme
MMSPPRFPVKTPSLLQRWQRMVQTKLWRMDIHTTAQIASSALIDRTWPRGIHIERGCVIDEQAVILTHDLTRGLYLDTRIGADSFVGARAIILPGITIGARCTIAPGTLVARDMPDDATASGNPATIVTVQDSA